MEPACADCYDEVIDQHRRFTMLFSRTPALAVIAAMAMLPVTAGAAAPPGTISMTEHQSITVASGAVLTYDSINDSRCPPGVQCVVAGKVVYSFTLTLGETREKFSLTPAEPAFTSAVLQGRQITLADAAPPPRATPAATAVSIRIVSP
jgi:hypothetical protein